MIWIGIDTVLLIFTFVEAVATFSQGLVWYGVIYTVLAIFWLLMLIRDFNKE